MKNINGGLFAENDEEAVYWQQAQDTKEYIKQCEASIRKAQSEIKMSPREVHQKFIKGAKENIKVRQLDIKVKREFLKFLEAHIKNAL